MSVPNRRGAQSARDISGTTLEQVSTQVELSVPGQWTLLLFLGSRCDACTGFWGALGTPPALGLERDDRLVVVTRPHRREDPDAIWALLDSAGGRPRVTAGGAHRDVVAPTLVMSDDAWHHYGVQGPPFFSLVDGVWVVTEGVAWSVDQVREDVRRRRLERSAPPPAGGQVRDPAVDASGSNTMSVTTSCHHAPNTGERDA